MSLIFIDENLVQSWTYSVGNGLTRELNVSGRQRLKCKSDTPFVFNQKKNYQYVTEIISNGSVNDVISMAFNSPFPTTQIDTNTNLDATSGVKFYAYAKPINNTSSNEIVDYIASHIINTTSTYIKNAEVNEIDFFINGQREYLDLGTQSSAVTQPSGWVYTESDLPNTGRYNWFYSATSSSVQPRYITSGTNLSSTYSVNFIASIIDYDSFNLELTYNFNSVGPNDMLNIYLVTQNNLTSFNNWQYVSSLTASGTFSQNGLLGKNADGTKNLLVISASYSTSDGSLMDAWVENIRILGSYHPSLNNTQQLLTQTNQYINNTALQIPDPDQDASYFYNLLLNNNLYPLFSKIGNGIFRSGIWENGVWNNGWRDDEQARDFDSVALSVLTNTDISWKVELRGSTYSIQGLSPGDKVAIGNIIAIDINDNRKLLKDYYTIENLGIDDSSQPSYGWIRVNLDTTFPYRRIEKDSPNHKIKVTKNIWLSGGFFNGYFSGVWNNGLFRGLPLLTEMYNTHWIDGYFNGGHFNSSYSDTFDITNLKPKEQCTNGYIDLVFTTNTTFVPGDYILSTITQPLVSQYSGTSQVIAVSPTQSIVNGVTQSYDIVTIDTIYNSQNFYTFTGVIGSAVRYTATGLIQNFNFYDNNRSQVKSNESGISSQVFSYNSWVDVNYDDSRAVTIGRDFRMYEPITKKSINRNNLYGYPTYDVLSSASRFRDSNTLDYKLYKLGTKYRVFNNFIGDSSQFNEPFNDLDFSQFTNAGWTYSYVNPYNSTIKRTESIIALNDVNAQNLIAGGITGDELFVTASNTGLILNSNLVNLEKKRYSVVEFDLMTYSVANQNHIYTNPDIYNIVSIPGSGYIKSNSTGLIISTCSVSSIGATVSDVVVSVNLYGSIPQIVINLKAPNGKIINLKKNSGGIGNRLNDTKFSLRDNFTKFSLITTPYSLNNTTIAYQDTYQYDAELSQTSGIYTSDVNTLAGLSASIPGIWTLYVAYPNTASVDLINWSINIEHIELFSQNIEPASNFPILHFNNLNYDVTTQTSGYETVQTYKSMTYLPINTNVDHLLTANTFRLDTVENMTPIKWGGFGSAQKTKKYEYFYNKTDLMMSILGNGATGASNSSVILDNINIYETDMIPFFKYFQDENIYKGIQIPFVGEAPNIDYLSSDFVFIDNITISVDTLEPGNGVTNSCIPISIVVNSYSIDFIGDTNNSRTFNVNSGTTTTTVTAQLLNNNILVNEPIIWSWSVISGNVSITSFDTDTVTINGLNNGSTVKLKVIAYIGADIVQNECWVYVSGSATNNNPSTNTRVITLQSATAEETITQYSPYDTNFTFNWITSGFTNITDINVQWIRSGDLWPTDSSYDSIGYGTLNLTSPNTTFSNTSSAIILFGNAPLPGIPLQDDYPIKVRLFAFDSGVNTPFFSNDVIISQATSLFRIRLVNPGASSVFRIEGGPANAECTLRFTSNGQFDPGRYFRIFENGVQQSGNIPLPINSPSYYAQLDSIGKSGDLNITTGGGPISGATLTVKIIECTINQVPQILPTPPNDSISLQLGV